jgi:hypothetical protein
VHCSLRLKAPAVALCLFLIWRAIVSLGWLGREVLSYDAQSMVDAVSLSQEQRIRRTLQGDYEVYETLREKVPENGRVLFVTGSTLAMAQRAMRVGLLLYPPRFDLVARLPAALPMEAGTPNAVFAVDFIRAETPEQSWELLESEKTFQLWRYRTSEQPAP